MSGELAARVSVVIPVRDGEAFLAQAIDSVLGQTVPAAEVIVVDDGSTDGSRSIARAYAGRVTAVERERSGGAAAAVNHGARVASGDMFAFLDADDLWTPDKLALQLRALAAQPGPALCFGHMEEFDDGATGSRRRLPGYSRGTMLLDRATWAQVGGFDESLRVGDFIDWFTRARDLGLRSLMLPQVLLRRRVHGSNMGLVRRDDWNDYARVAKRALDRRRSGTGR